MHVVCECIELLYRPVFGGRNAAWSSYSKLPKFLGFIGRQIMLDAYQRPYEGGDSVPAFLLNGSFNRNLSSQLADSGSGLGALTRTTDL